MSPKTFGRYEIIRELGRGGMATVFLARDPRFEREVAVKVLPRQFTHDPQFRVRFEREARIIARLDHSAIVPVFDYGEEDEQPFLVMRYMPGGSLADRLDKGPIPLPDVGKILSRIASALDRAHSINIVHRDLKPANILFDQYGDAFLADFGIVKVAQATSTLTGSAIIGTPAYMSPEQVQGTAVDGKSDIYTLGVILFEMLTGKQPYAADTPMGMAVKHIIDPVPRLLDARSDLSPGLDQMLSRAMAKEADKRFSSATDLAASVTAELQGQPPPQRPAARVRPPAEAAPSRPPRQTAPAAVGQPDSLTGLVAETEVPPQAVSEPLVPPASPPTRRRAPVWIWGFAALFLIGVFLLGYRLLSNTSRAPVEPGLNAADFIDSQGMDGFQVTNVAYGGEIWSVFMSQGGPYGRQDFLFTESFPENEIAAAWETEYRVTELTYGDGGWVLIISPETPHGRQIWTTRQEIPEDFIIDGWDEGFRITDWTFGQGIWAVMMSQGSLYGRQIWQTSFEFPQGYIEDGWANEFRVTDLTYGDGVWAIVMSQETPYGRQIWTTAQEFPADFIQNGWEDGFRLTELTYGQGVWAVVMSQGSPYPRQVWQNSRHFLPDE